MESYLVGGAVRDKLLGLVVHDRDWVVIGETPDSMQAAGFRAVGKDFPVFLHPETQEEYALARTERKTGPGYRGFSFNTDASVTLEQDLQRRDFTINAMAENAHGDIVDPFSGREDLNNRLLRHVSAAFTEDPVRVLRAARFMARFAHFGFKLADDTLLLMRSMVDNGEVDNLVAERVWQELASALTTPHPETFFNTLHSVAALKPILPEIHSLLMADGHDENAAEQSTMRSSPEPSQHIAWQSLILASGLSQQPHVRFAALSAGFGAHGVANVKRLCQRLRAPNNVTDLAMLSSKLTAQAINAKALGAEQLHALLKAVDINRKPTRFKDFLTVVQAYTAAQKGVSNVSELPDSTPQTHLLLQCAEAMLSINAAEIAKSNRGSSAIATAIKQAELAAIESVAL